MVLFNSFPPSPPGFVTVDPAGGFFVSEGVGTMTSNYLSRITAAGVRTVIFEWPWPTFPTAQPHQVAIAANGDFIVAESGADTLSRITPGGLRTIIRTFPVDTNPLGVAVGPNGYFFVLESGERTDTSFPILSRISSDGMQRIPIFAFAQGALPHAITIDHLARFIISENRHHKLVRITWDGITPLGGVRQEVFTFPNPGSDLGPNGVAIDCDRNYVVANCGLNKLYHITSGVDGGPMGVPTTIFDFAPGSCPSGIDIVKEDKLYVDQAATGLGFGCSWANAFLRLQDALVEANSRNTDGNGANDIDEIWVADGTYKPTDKSCTTAADCGGAPNSCPAGACVWDEPRAQTFQLLNGVALYGGFAGGETSLDQRNPAVNVTILSGDDNSDDVLLPCKAPEDCLVIGPVCGEDGFCIIADNNDENSYHVVTGSGRNATAILDGFTITKGHADGIGVADSGAGMLNVGGSPTMLNCAVRGNAALELGAGIYTTGGLTAIDCIITGNAAGQSGGGLLNQAGNPTITGCTFAENSASGGAGIMNIGGSPTVSGCIFRENSAVSSGGAISMVSPGTPRVINCSFAGNRASGGGALFVNANSGPILVNCSFFGNHATTTGGAIYNISNAAQSITNALFSGNSAASNAGGIFNGCSSCSLTLKNSSLSGNEATAFGGFFATGGTNTLDNCILWGNTHDQPNVEQAQIRWTGGTLAVNYSLVQGWSGTLPGTASSGGDPFFVDADGPDNIPGTLDDDLRLRPGSPAIDAADTTALPADVADLDGDMNTAEQIPFDLEGNPRRVDDPNVTDSGVGAAPIVDMGAYEFQANVLFVDASATGSNNGSSWINAFTRLQNGLSYAAANPQVTEIWVADGTYKPTEESCTVDADCGGGLPNTCSAPGGPCVWDQPRAQTFQLLNGVALYGGFAGGETLLSQRDPAVNVAILSGDLNGNDGPNFANNGENSCHIVAGSNTDSTAVIDGFTVQGGNANGIPLGCVGPLGADDGGAVFVENGNPTIRGCTFIANRAFDNGGAILLENSDSKVSFCTFIGNRADAASAQGGGALAVGFMGSPVIDSCLFDHNSCAHDGGAVFNISENTVMLTHCTFIGNSAEDGGALASSVSASGCGIVANSIFSGNSATSNGGAIANLNGFTTLTN